MIVTKEQFEEDVERWTFTDANGTSMLFFFKRAPVYSEFHTGITLYVYEEEHDEYEFEWSSGNQEAEILPSGDAMELFEDISLEGYLFDLSYHGNKFVTQPEFPSIYSSGYSEHLFFADAEDQPRIAVSLFGSITWSRQSIAPTATRVLQGDELHYCLPLQ